MRGSIFRSLRGVRAGKLELELELELFSEKSVVESVELPRHVARQFERSRKIRENSSVLQSGRPV